MWQQLKPAKLGIDYKGGLCLVAVRESFGINQKYGSATLDWITGNRHIGVLPSAGIAVPVYFALKNEPDGHVAIMLPDGRVASSTQEGVHKGLYIHSNLNDLIRIYAKAQGGCTYLGWSEEVNDVPVVRSIGDQEMTNEEHAKQVVRLLADVIEGNPHYEESQPVGFKGHVNRILTSSNPLEDRLVGKDFMNNYIATHPTNPDSAKLQVKIDNAKKALG